MKETPYFRNEVLKRRPYLKEEWLQRAIDDPDYTEMQPNGRIKHWIFVAEFNKYLRVVTLEDGETIHTAFPDRGFRPEK